MQRRMIVSIALKVKRSLSRSLPLVIGPIFVGQSARGSVRLWLLLKIKSTETYGPQRSPSSWSSLCRRRCRRCCRCRRWMFGARVTRWWTGNARMRHSRCGVHRLEGCRRRWSQWMLLNVRRKCL